MADLTMPAMRGCEPEEPLPGITCVLPGSIVRDRDETAAKENGR